MKLEVTTLPLDALLAKHGVQKGGPVQKLIDTECMRYMGPYMPRRQAGELEHMMIMSTVVGDGEINTPGPYAHYLYEGIVYVDPKYNCAGFLSRTPGEYFGQWFSRKGVTKVMSNPVRELRYTGAPMRGKKWFERMKSDHKDDILRAAQAMAAKGVKT